MLNWSIRYNKILQQNPALFDPRKSVLEVGCGPMGGALYLKRPVTGLELRAIEPRTEWLTIVQGNILNIPFPDGAFDFVLCIDLLEHLTIGERPLAIKELWRVARERVLISCPCHKWALRGEQELANFFRGVGQQVPEWLVEHLDRDFPKIGQIIDCITDLNMPIEFCGNETMMQHYGGIFVDLFLPYANELQQNQQWKAPLGLPIGGSEWDLFYSYLFTLRKGSLHWGNKRFHADPKLYAVCHNASTLPGNLGDIEPAFAGAAADVAPEGALTDITQYEPRLLNSRWSELSAIYKIWREGPRSSVVGFCHYRRFFAFSAEQTHTAREIHVNKSTLSELASSLVDLGAMARCKDDVIIVPRPVKLYESIFDHYCSGHNTNDWCWVMGRLSVVYPELIPHLRTQFEAGDLYACNMFVMKWESFDEICRIWFDVLRSFEEAVKPYRATPYQNRDISFLSERIFDAWLRYKQATGTRIVETPIYFVT